MIKHLCVVCLLGVTVGRAEEVPVDTKDRNYPEDPPIEEARPENYPPGIRVEGRWLLDPDGNRVWLQGVAIPGLEITSKGHGVVHSTIVAIEEWKANVVRLAIKDEFWYGKGDGRRDDDEPQTDGGAAYRAIVDAAVQAAANRGAYLVIDHHRYRAVRPEHLPFWKELAERYKNHPAVIFDIINEPHGISWEVWRNGGEVFRGRSDVPDESAFLSNEERQANLEFTSPGMQALVDAIRETGARNLIIAGALDWAYDLSGILKGCALEDPNGNGIMYASHVYPWKRGWQRAFLDVVEHHPVFMGEVGASIHKMSFIPEEIQEDPETWVPDILGLIQQHQIHWTGWSFHTWATPTLLLDWKNHTPTPYWGEPAKRALAGERFPPPERLR
ncbi:MAG: cellulase family glycosylhydrolase [Opitutales bacterium]